MVLSFEKYMHDSVFFELDFFFHLMVLQQLEVRVVSITFDGEMSGCFCLFDMGFLDNFRDFESFLFIK